MRVKGVVAGVVATVVGLMVATMVPMATMAPAEAAAPAAAVVVPKTVPARKAAHAGAAKVYRVPQPVRGGQRVIDEGCATLYQGPMPGARQRGTTWIAGHNYAGWAYWAKIPRGAKVVVKGVGGRPVAYRVVGRTYIPRQGGSARGLVHHDLMLQTCSGTGTMITYANRIR